MKNIFLLLLMMCMTTGIYAQEEFTIDNINYKTISSDYVTVTGAEGEVFSLSFPEMVNHNGKTYSVYKVEKEAFKNRQDIHYLSIPSSMKIIGTEAFHKCKNLIKITFATNSVEIIEEGAFWECHQLMQFTLPNTLQAIGPHAFSWCNPSVINLPKQLTSIGDRAFFYCRSNIGTIISEIENPFLCPIPTPNDFWVDAFYATLVGERNTYRDASLLVPKGTIELYKTAPGWKEFQNIFEIGNETNIGNITNTNNSSNTWYDIYGTKLKEKPIKSGIYIYNGKKVIIK